MNHFVANYFHFYLGNDRLHTQFEGLLAGWRLHIGPGAYTTNIDEVIDNWPYNPNDLKNKVLSVLLGS